MARWTFLIVSLFSLHFFGCAPTVPKLIEMRGITGADSALHAQEKLITYFAQPTDNAVWRAQAMKTMAHIDATFSHASFHPGVHRDVERLFMDEYSAPKVPDSVRASRVYQLKAYSVHMLGKLDRPYYLDFYLGVLERHNNRTDGRYDIRLAAVDGVLGEMDRLSRYKGLRRRLLSDCATLKGEIHVAITENQRRILNAIRTIEKGLLSYADIVDLLPDESNEITDAKLLELLRWNHTALLSRQHEGKTDLYETNKLKLLGLIHHKNPSVRLKAREILADVDPYPLFRELAPHVADPARAAPNDYIHTMRLIAVLDSKLKSQPDYRKLRDAAIAAFFKQPQTHSSELRTEVYSALMMADPRLLADRLLAGNETTMNDDQRDAALQHIDFLNRLRMASADNRKQQESLTNAIAEWMNVPSMTIRARVTAILLKDAPQVLAIAVARRLPKISQEDNEPAQYLVEAYISALSKLEKGTLDADFEKAILLEFSVDPYRLLLNGLAKDSYEIRSIIANFMSSRNPSAFAEAMAAQLAAKLPLKGTEQYRILGLLGDFALKHKDVLNGKRIQTVINTLRKGLRVNNEDTILLCCRYILELGGAVKQTDFARPIRSAQAMIQLAGKEVK